jgi:hypothetical protein
MEKDKRNKSKRDKKARGEKTWMRKLGEERKKNCIRGRKTMKMRARAGTELADGEQQKPENQSVLARTSEGKKKKKTQEEREKAFIL